MGVLSCKSVSRQITVISDTIRFTLPYKNAFNPLIMDIRFAANPADFKHYTTDRLRQDFLMESLFVVGDLNLVYSHYDRVITGGVVPTIGQIGLSNPAPLRADYFLERRELGIINVGNSGQVIADGVTYSLANKECLYLGKGTKDVAFLSEDEANPAKFYLLSSPAHTAYPAATMTLAEASPIETGAAETANCRTIYKFIHKDGIKSCQLVMGMTLFKPGSIWNTMPCHFHDRRMEVYLYFDLDANARVFHFMGEPHETRHLIVANEQAIISPPWSIHTGTATASYSFIWGMAGENQDYADMDFVTMDQLK